MFTAHYADGSPVDNFARSINDGTRWQRSVDNTTWQLTNFWELTHTDLRQRYSDRESWEQPWPVVAERHGPLTRDPDAPTAYTPQRPTMMHDPAWLDEVRIALEIPSPQIDQRDRDVLRLLYGLDGYRPRSTDELAVLYGVTRARISALSSSALRAMAVWPVRHVPLPEGVPPLR